MPTSPTKITRARQEQWLDQHWGGKSWLHDDVRFAHENPPEQNELSAGALDSLVKITKLAQEKGIELPSLWDQASPYNVLWTGVHRHPNSSLRLTDDVASAAYNNLETIICSQQTQDTGGSLDNVIMESPNIEPGAFIHATNKDIESDSSEDEATEFVPKATRSRSTSLGGSPKLPDKLPDKPPAKPPAEPPTKVTGNEKKMSLFASSRPPAPEEQKPAAPKALYKTSSIPMNLFRQSRQPPGAILPKRKRKRDSKTTTTDRSTKGAKPSNGGDEVVDEAVAIYWQLTNNVQLTDVTLNLLTNAMIFWYPPQQGKIKVLDPLWFKVEGTTTGHNIKLDGITKLCFSIHHPKPKHWTLAIIDIDGDEKSMVFNHHDAIPCKERFDTVCASFHKWKETSACDFKLRFNNITPCTMQQDDINCGIHVISCLRHALTGKPCPKVLNPREERKFLRQKIKESEGNPRLQEIKTVIEKYDYGRLFDVIRNEKSESLEADKHLATIALDNARNGLKDAQTALIHLKNQRDTVAETLSRLDAEIGTHAELARPLGHELSGGARVNNQQELSVHMSQLNKIYVDQSFANGSEVGRKVIREQYGEIIEKLVQAEKNVAQKQEELNKATKLLEYKTRMRDLKVNIHNILNEQASLLPWNN
ncbi:hypothetical protein FPRO06_13249 [Fusarium proliferatum]|nr:hypothetical protein FPRO06_13249 [Fusarium proliferatum]KAI1066471.1 hypothetical protein LB506_008379 [Fusarium annulatum]CVL08885.1 uncharacterized protein FPRN_14655 [Fusarium proliferatum]